MAVIGPRQGAIRQYTIEPIQWLRGRAHRQARRAGIDMVECQAPY